MMNYFRNGCFPDRPLVDEDCEKKVALSDESNFGKNIHHVIEYNRTITGRAHSLWEIE